MLVITGKREGGDFYLHESLIIYWEKESIKLCKDCNEPNVWGIFDISNLFSPLEKNFLILVN